MYFALTVVLGSSTKNFCFVQTPVFPKGPFGKENILLFNTQYHFVLLVQSSTMVFLILPVRGTRKIFLYVFILCNCIFWTRL